MLGIYDMVINVATRSEKWRKKTSHHAEMPLTDFERMQLDALRQRELRARDMGLIK